MSLKLVLAAIVIVGLYIRSKNRSLVRINANDKPIKVFLVTGAGSGIAQRLVTKLLDLGHSVVATDINYESLSKSHQDLWNSSRCKIMKLDVRSPSEWKEAMDFTVQSFGRIDVLLNIAGYLKPGKGHEQDSNQVDLHIDINMKGMIFGCQAACEVMLKQSFGHIINFASLAGVSFVPGNTLYAASKWGSRGFSNTLYFDLIDKGIHVSTVCPDAVQTPMLQKQVGDANAALTFSMGKILTVDQVCDSVINIVIPFKPRELCIPERSGTICKLTQFLPTSFLLFFSKIMQERGKSNQKKINATK